MTADGYRTVFDVTEVGYKSWFFPALGLAFVMITLVLRFLNRRGLWSEVRTPNPRGFLQVAFYFSVFWTMTAFTFTYYDYRMAIGAMRDGSAELVEGPVTDFVPMPHSGHSDESFRVQGVNFAFSDYTVTAGFNHTLSHGGSVRGGSHVRIWHIDGEILRLEIKEGPNQAPQTTPVSAPR
jgi:hypothetical protein